MLKGYLNLVSENCFVAGGSMRRPSWRFDTIKEFYSKNMSFPEVLNIHCDMNESSLASFSKARSSVRNFLESGSL